MEMRQAGMSRFRATLGSNANLGEALFRATTPHSENTSSLLGTFLQLVALKVMVLPLECNIMGREFTEFVSLSERYKVQISTP